MRPLVSIASLVFGLAANAGGAAQVAATPAFELHSDDFDRVRGEYALPDGHVVWVAGTRRHPRLDLDNGRSRALRALSASEFISEDGCTRVVFEAQANANVTRLGMTHPRECAAR